MLPDKIRRFVSKLVQRTEAGEIPWEYDLFDAVAWREKDFSVSLEYSFDAKNACGVFRFVYRDAAGQRYEFYTNSDCDDYPMTKHLFDSAQATKMELPF
ncbi:hypothetical protein [Mitsuaria sp. GD03876]|uniref:hypothetical protein n=1 Tax=Mitsuaria sp. GD03876 TaxID=2975399 RepID=UPI00244B37EE|nr:hypothetical protein [Mitsuaria sp. GD03876]MDH0862910.1 hypothetical protein [Mitsuaria sp. GD03876]